jgi:hypothetical protein
MSKRSDGAVSVEGKGQAQSTAPGASALDPSLARLRQAVEKHQEFLLLLALFLAFRLMVVLVMRPGGYLGVMTTFHYYHLLQSLANQGYLPLVDFWVEYPPLMPWLLLAVYRFSLLIPAWTEPGAWYLTLLGATFALFEAGNLILFYAIGRRLHGRAEAVRLAWIYGALFIPVVTLLNTFDNVVLFFLLWVVLLALDRRPAGAGAAAGVGFMAKLVPVVAVPAAWLHLPVRSQRARLVAAAILVVMLIALPFLLAGPQNFWPAFTGVVGRGSWETVWALVDGYYSFGVAGGPDRFDPSHAGAWQHPSVVPTLPVTIAFGLFYLWLLTRRAAWQERRVAVAFVALSQNLLLLYARGYSPQFLVMVLPFLLLLLPAWRGVLYALLLSAASLVEYPIYFVVLPGEPWLLAGAVLLRTLLLVIVSLEFAAQVYGWRVAPSLWRRVALSTLALSVVLGLAGGLAGFRAYWQARYQASPHHEAMERVVASAAPGASVVVDEQDVYEGIYPYLHRRFRVRSVETHDYLPPWEARLEEATREAGELWLYARAGSPLYGWLAAHRSLLTEHQIEGRVLSAWEGGR